MIDQGYLVADRYKIISTLGEGGMSNVYLAEDVILQRKVALKVLRLDLQNDPATVRRFQREALSTSELSHPNIVSILDVGEDKGMQYLVMEYVSGSNLKQYISMNYPLSKEHVITIMDQILSAMELAHQHNVIHRDLKPQNILIDENGNAKIADFGIAIALSEHSITQTNSLLGSVHYISPEQAKGAMATKKSDIYSLGIILYEMLTGKVPFGGETAVSVALKHFQEKIPSIRERNSDVPQALENVVLKATAKNPDDRYESITDMKNDLDTSLSESRKNEPIFVPLNNPELDETKVLPDLSGKVLNNSNHFDDETKKDEKKSLKENIKKHKWWWIIGAIAFVAILAGLIYSLSGNKSVKVPDLSNQTAAEAKVTLTNAKLKLGNVSEEESDKVDKGEVIRSLPEKNMNVKENSTISIIVSSGPKTTKVPDVTGMTFDEAKQSLEKLGFTVSKKTEYSNDVPKDNVIKQDTKANQKVVAKDTSIVLTVSLGVENKSFKLDDLSTYDENGVKQYADKNGLDLTIERDYSDTVAVGKVISQDPGANATVAGGSKIRVKISLGKSKEVTKTYSVEYKDPDEDKNATDEDSQSSSSKTKKPNKIQIFIQDDNNKIDSVKLSQDINNDTRFDVPFTLNKGDGHIIIKRDGETVIDEAVRAN